MNKIRIATLLLLLISFITMLSPIPVMADTYTLYESLVITADSSSELYLANYFAQTFTVGSVRHTVDRIRLNLSAEGVTPGNLYVSIRATDGSGNPNGLDLSTGAYSGALLTVSTTIGKMYEIIMTPVTLEANTKYAIVCYGTGTTNILNIHWYKDGSAGAYTDGSYFSSITGGIDWTADTDDDFMFQVWGVSAASTIDDIKVFQGYMESDDWLITTTNHITDTCNNFANIWKMQLIDSVTSTVYAESTISQCGMRPASIYLSAAMGSTLTWGGNYSIKLYGNYGSLPSTTRLINSSTDWIGSISLIDGWALQQAQIMEDYDNVDYVTIVPQPYNEVLTIEGGSIFDRGIPYLSIYRPNIFQVTTHLTTIEYTPYNGSTDYADDLYSDWEGALGVPLSSALTDIAPYFGFTGVDGGRMVGALMILIGFLAVAAVEKSIAFIIILGGVLCGLIPLYTVLFLVFVLSVVLIRSLFWSST
jgi:hypothetical protein